MVVIRLARQGRAKYPVYRIVAADSRRPATGKFVAILGQYNPHTKDLVVKHDEAKRFLANGAQPSNSVIKLFVKEGIDMPAWAKFKTKAPKPKEEAAEVTPEEAAADSEATDAEVTEEAAEPTAETEERVASVATEEASAAEEQAQPIDHTETAADNEQAADNAENAKAVAAEAAQSEAAPQDETAA